MRRLISPRATPGVRIGLVAVAVGAAFACASRSELTRIDARTYRVECAGPLANCLVPVQEVCKPHGYDVLAGTERRSYVGTPSPEGYESVKANATVRCRAAVPLFGPDPNLPASASASAQPAPPPATPPVAPSASAP
jgi:hypothetical protein